LLNILKIYIPKETLIFKMFLKKRRDDLKKRSLLEFVLNFCDLFINVIKLLIVRVTASFERILRIANF